jgi:hypothetical protein
MMRKKIGVVLLVGCLTFVVLAACSKQPTMDSKIPVIYFTDLFHPHDDPDDHFDLLALYALPELAVKAIILDQGLKQDRRSGAVPIHQLNKLTGRSVPHAKGLAYALQFQGDDGTQQPQQYQEGVELVIKTLKESDDKVTLVSVGSLRDMAAAYNRAPDLFREKVGRIYSFIGEASMEEFIEYNVDLDRKAFATIMNSGLPIFWMPCFDGGLWKNNGLASYWQVKQQYLLEGTDERVKNFFRYALLSPQQGPTVNDFTEKIGEADLNQLYAPLRNLWSTAVFTHAAGQKIINRDNDWILVSQKKGELFKEPGLFSFTPVRLWVDDEGIVHYDNSARSNEILRYTVTDPVNYGDGMTHITKTLFQNLAWEK